MSSMAREYQVTFIGISPNPVRTLNTLLVSVGIAEIDLQWLDWATTIWANVASLKWGA